MNINMKKTVTVTKSVVFPNKMSVMNFAERKHGELCFSLTKKKKKKNRASGRNLYNILAFLQKPIISPGFTVQPGRHEELIL